MDIVFGALTIYITPSLELKLCYILAIIVFKAFVGRLVIPIFPRLITKIHDSIYPGSIKLLTI